MLRTRYLIAYDIADSKRLYHIHKQIEGYAIGGQKSFYECWLTSYELNKLKAKISTLINTDEDQILICQLSEDTEPELFGKAHLQSTQLFLLV